MSRPLRILLVSAEIDPIASTGELGRSVSGLAKALKQGAVDARVIMPRYKQINLPAGSVTRLVEKFRIRSVNRFGELGIFRAELTPDVEVPVYLLDKDKYFARDAIYGAPQKAYDDNAERFSFFNLATLEALPQIGFYPDVIHCHDWHTGLIPVYLKTLFATNPLYAQMKTLFTIHDLLHQGWFPKDALQGTGLPDTVFTPEKIEFYGGVSFLKGGLGYADIITTESKRYAQEIQTKEFGRGFEGILQNRSKDLYGVLNGVEYKSYDPRLDAHIAFNYNKEEIGKKALCKQDLLHVCGWPNAPDRPLVAMIAPLHEEAGLDLLLELLPRVAELGIYLVFLHDGNVPHDRYAAALREFAARAPQDVRCYLEYQETLKHKILAGADLLLLPSKSEPCGVTQMYALKYGTIPVARATGGLDDTIVDFSADSGKGTGFKFAAYTCEALLAKLREALALYQSRDRWDLLQANAMRVNHSWVYSANKYVDLYHKLVLNKSKTPANLA